MSSAVDDRSPDRYVDPYLPKADLLVLQSLLQDVEDDRTKDAALDLNLKSALRGKVDAIKRPASTTGSDSGYESLTPSGIDSGYESLTPSSVASSSVNLLELSKNEAEPASELRARHSSAAPVIDAAHLPRDKQLEDTLDAMNNPQHQDFEPSVFSMWDVRELSTSIPKPINDLLLQPYIRWARTVVRNPTDVIMLTHLVLYACTTIPSAVYLFYRPTTLHGLLHWAMQGYFTGTYTLMMHQHIHMRGVLGPAYAWLDAAFPYILDPMFGHTWNSYFHHHVKHHHVEGNGPDDLSSTIRYQRDSVFDFACYVARFYLLVWIELPMYFLRKRKYGLMARATACELGTFTMIYLLWNYVSWKATLFVYVLPLAILRIGLMVGNWGQHAFVDEMEPDSDYRSSITLIDVPSNRFCYNDGYHTSHHLNPRRHWRDHPNAFLKQKRRYAEENALVFRNIDYIMLTVRILRKDYAYLAKCLVPMGSQIAMTQDEIAAMLRTKTKRFTEEEIKAKFRS